MRPPLNHMMLNEDALADEFAAIFGYRKTHVGLVLPGSTLTDESSTPITDESGTEITDE